MKTEMKNREQNFISVVVYVNKADDKTIDFFQKLNTTLVEHFLQYEIIVVHSGESSQNIFPLKNWAKGIDKPVTMIQMSLKQPHEQCMNAGLDIAIGDYVFEFDSTDMSYSPDMIWKAYELAMQGNDIVSICPSQEHLSSHLFYRVFNAHSNAGYKLRSDAFRLVSRRAINRVHAISDNLPYRKAAYAACGLKMAELEFNGKLNKKPQRFRLAIDSLTLYTDFGYKFSFWLTLFMMLIAVVELIYTVIVFLTGNPISGWTTTMLVLTIGFAGLFAVLAVILKFLTLLMSFVFKKQSYLIESIEKL